MLLKLFSLKQRVPSVRKNEYATPADFCKLFSQHLNSFYVLLLVLTADHEKAEDCMLLALEDCLESKTVFKEWAHSWAKRTAIKTAIRLVLGSETPADMQVEAGRIEDAMSGANALLAGIATLRPFNRFVYVMSVLEKMSDTECALLLDCSVREVVAAKKRALQTMRDVQSVRMRGENLRVAPMAEHCALRS